jgi:hypothetical protein
MALAPTEEENLFMLKRVQHKKDATAIGAIKELSVFSRTVEIRFNQYVFPNPKLRILAVHNLQPTTYNQQPK